MKVISKDTRDKTFKKFDLVFTIETEDELKALYSVFNHSDIHDFLSVYGIEPEDTKKEIRRRCDIETLQERIDWCDDVFQNLLDHLD